MLLKMHLVKVHIAVFWGFFSPAVTHCNIRGSKNEGLLFGCIAFLSILLLHPVSNVHQHVFHKALHGTMVLWMDNSCVECTAVCCWPTLCWERNVALTLGTFPSCSQRCSSFSGERERNTKKTKSRIKRVINKNVLFPHHSQTLFYRLIFFFYDGEMRAYIFYQNTKYNKTFNWRTRYCMYY